MGVEQGQPTMKRAFLLAACAAGLATSAQATEDFCAVVLKTPDGFLALREWPGTRFAVKAKLHRGDVLYADTAQCSPSACNDTKNWTHVLSVPRIDGRLEEAKQFTQGWVARKFIQEFICPEESVASSEPTLGQVSGVWSDS
jgi:hypothetical protein